MNKVIGEDALRRARAAIPEEAAWAGADGALNRPGVPQRAACPAPEGLAESDMNLSG